MRASECCLQRSAASGCRQNPPFSARLALPCGHAAGLMMFIVPPTTGLSAWGGTPPAVVACRASPTMQGNDKAYRALRWCCKPLRRKKCCNAFDLSHVRTTCIEATYLGVVVLECSFRCEKRGKYAWAYPRARAWLGEFQADVRDSRPAERVGATGGCSGAG